MQLTPGQTLLHFTLVDKIGAGGMGEVWKAIDTTLDREVAIKVIPGAFSGDRERLARFEREAKVLAALSHANIAGIYGFPEADAPGEPGGGKVRFLAMELVRGEDLAQILARGPMPVPDALEAARQVATALEAAHASGIIHRDLKPANIKRTPDGQIKVLDFGLAKALEAVGAPAGAGATVNDYDTFLVRADQPGRPLTFTEDGAALFVAGRSVPIEIERVELATGKRTPWMTMAPTDPAGLRYAIATITPNGKYWALSTAKLLTDLYIVEGLR